eukprot:179041_1
MEGLTSSTWFIIFITQMFNVLNIILGLYSIIKLRCGKSKLLNKLTIVNYLLYIFSGVCFSIHIVLYITTGINEWIKLILYTSAFTLYMFGLILSCILYLLRLEHRFKGTRFAITKPIYILFIVLFIIQILSTLSTAILLLYNKFILNIAYFTFGITNSISTILLLYTFCKILYYLGIQNDNKEIEMENIANPSIQSHTGELSVELTGSISSTTVTATDLELKLQQDSPQHLNPVRKRRKHNKFVTKTIRNLFCAFIALISSNMLSILGIYRMIVNDNPLLWILHVMLIVFDQIINIMCFNLGHKYMKASYYRYCLCCHKMVYRIFINQQIVDSTYSIALSHTSIGVEEKIQYSKDSASSSMPHGLPKLHRDPTPNLDDSNTF